MPPDLILWAIIGTFSGVLFGLIPGAGGNLRMISNLSRKIKSAMPGAFPIIQKAFETIGFAEKDFRGEKCNRLKQIELIKSENKINGSLYWR